MRRIAPFVLGVILYVPGALWLLRKRAGVALILWALAGGIFLTLAAVHVRDTIFYRLFAVTISGNDGGWHMAITRINDLMTTLVRWPKFMAESESISGHMAISPPGLVVLYYTTGALLAHFPALARVLARPLRWPLCQDYVILSYTNGQIAAAWLGILMPL
ncbi:MAG: hypothetical protein EXR62_17105 [Chloroflexi bacterium]|nr:hypothetical protein [Chloroflexota bacterium]